MFKFLRKKSKTIPPDISHPEIPDSSHPDSPHSEISDSHSEHVSGTKNNVNTYRLLPTNYSILSPDEKTIALLNFVRIIKSTEHKLKMSIITKKTETIIAGKKHDFFEKSVYLTSYGVELGPILLGNNFRHMRTEEILEFPIKRENLKSLIMESGAWWRIYTVFSFPKNIRPAWLSILSGMCSIVNVEVFPTGPDVARRMLAAYANSLESKPGRRNHEEAGEARAVCDLLQKKDTTLWEYSITAIVTASSQKELERNCTNFERDARREQISVMAVSGKQADIMKGWGARMLMPEQSCAKLYPFHSVDLMEDNGVYLGRNELNGTPVVFDYQMRTNYNMTIMGKSGSGKSMTSKTYVSNFMEVMRKNYSDSRVMVYILDPHGEYTKLAEHLGMNVVDLNSRDELGLDPFKLMQTADAATGFLTDAMENMPENFKSLCQSHSKGVTSTVQLVEKLRNDQSDDVEDCRKAATFLVQYTEGGLANVFRGKFSLKDKTILSMRKANKSRVNAMILSLALQKVWNEMRSAPEYVPKFLVIDEAWFTLQMDATAGILEDIARSGRKENVHMVVMTQDVDDVLNSRQGVQIIKNSSTILIMRLLRESADMLEKVLELSRHESDELTILDRGEGILRADDNRLKVRIMPTASQLELFNTKAPSRSKV